MHTPKVCIITETYYPVIGGGETQARELAEGLINSGFSVIVITRRSDPSFKKVERFGEISVYRLPPVGVGHLKKWGLLVTSFPALIKLRHQYDLVYVSGFRRIGLAAVIVSKLFGKACVLKADSQGEMSGDYFCAGLKRLRLRPSSLPVRTLLALRNKVLRHADAFVAITSGIAEEFLANGVSPDALYRIPNGVNTRKFRPVPEHQKEWLRHKLGLPHSNIIIVFTGRLVTYKGLPLLLRVFGEMLKKWNQISLILLGSGGTDIHNCELELKEYVKSNKLEETVFFLGDVRNVDEYLQASDIFVFPTENDAFPVAVIEAMACGLAVISTGVGAIESILQHRDNGLIVKTGDCQELYDAFEKLINDATFRLSLGGAAWKAVHVKYSVEIVTQGYGKLFERMIEQGRGMSALGFSDR